MALANAGYGPLAGFDPRFTRRALPHGIHRCFTTQGLAPLPEGAAGPEGLVYLGVILKGDVKQALLQDSDGVRVLHEGERIRGLEIRRISAEGGTLAGSSGEVHLPAPVDNSESIEIRQLQ